MITLETLKFLQSQAGFELLEELKTADLSEANTLRLLTQLRKRYSPENAAAALETARLRVKAQDQNKFFNHTNQMLFTREALEQSSNHLTSWIHADILHNSGYQDRSRVFADLGCGIGADTIAIAETYPGLLERKIVALDIDPLRLSIASFNCGIAHKARAFFIQADLTQQLPFKDIHYAFFDPARRSEGKRIFSVKDYLPNLDTILNWPFEVLITKLSPGVDISELSPYLGTLWFVSVDNELKEALLIRGGEQDNKETTAVICHRNSHELPQAEVIRSENIPSPPLRQPQGYLYEPDPAVIRTGLLGELAERLEISMYRMDETIAYLTSDTYIQSGLARAWIIDDWMPFNLKKLRAYLRERNVGRVTVKKRGSPITPEELIAQLKLSGDGEERVVVLTHVMGQPAVLICRTIDRA